MGEKEEEKFKCVELLVNFKSFNDKSKELILFQQSCLKYCNMKWIVIVNFYQVNCDGKNIFVVKNFVEFNNFCFDDFTWNFSSTYFGFFRYCFAKSILHYRFTLWELLKDLWWKIFISEIINLNDRTTGKYWINGKENSFYFLN